ncbi:POTRA domain-containing protein [Limnobacter litoralis]|uniref:Polypeptide-transport-associated ShlB-type domain-containing protein n=1 Tax=Limnobacter litoralis TaxID=481366 RepID=A0ABQ5YQ91_9BURK|nr:POTRA domain-containing protein [Limnobacter litoralis]GLR26780.1 hypothetical protein GCM10007875_18700 [Limnobacter litoralis]
MNYKEYACSTLLAVGLVLPVISYVNPVHAATADAAEKDPTFVVSAFKVEGPVLIPRAEIDKVLALYANRPLTFSDLREATVRVEKLHADAGFEVVRAIIPEQDLTPGGTLTIQIVDARLDEVKVGGNAHFSSDQIRKGLVVLSPGALINTMDMDRNLRVLNDNPAINARVTLEPSDKPALVDAQVKVQDQNPLGAYVTFDNTGTSSTGRFRLGLVVIDNNVFGKGAHADCTNSHTTGVVVRCAGVRPDLPGAFLRAKRNSRPDLQRFQCKCGHLQYWLFQFECAGRWYHNRRQMD